jgi:hypothetical protein
MVEGATTGVELSLPGITGSSGAVMLRFQETLVYIQILDFLKEEKIVYIIIYI